MDNLEHFLTTASNLGMRVILALFDGTGCCDADVSWITSGQYNSTGWIAGPGNAMVNNASIWAVLDQYVAAITSAYGKDPRVVGWDVMYQPIVQLPSEGGSYNFLTHFSASVAAAVDANVAFTTISIIPGAEVCDAQRVPTDSLNVLSFENYNGNLGAIGGDTQGVQGCASSLAPKHGGKALPVILSGTMGRNSVPPQGLCDCLFEASGQPWVDIPSHPPVGVIITNLMIGVDGSAWGPPSQPPNQGLIYPNGTWYSQQELQCMLAPVPGPPPPPPGPPAPVVNFTAGGLTVGLRPVSRAIEVLALQQDTRWFFNFSFVPPLWNFLPERPHRDGPGCHHIGDLILRVQPASETNASSWAMYSTAQGADQTPVTPLNSTNQDIFDASDITPALLAGGQPDTRYSLGLQVTRYFEVAPLPNGAADGFRMRFSITNTNSTAVRIGSIGIPLLTDSNFGGLNLTQVAAFTSFLEGYPGGPRSFATLTRADGTDTAVIWPCEAGPGLPPTPMEAWRPVLEDSSNTGGGVYSWEVVAGAYGPEWAANRQFPSYMEMDNDPDHNAAWPNPKSPTPSWHLAETLWRPNPRQWNPLTTWTLAPGEKKDVAVCFALAKPATPGTQEDKSDAEVLEARAAVARAMTTGVSPSSKPGPRARDATLARVGQPVLFPVPGYVIGTDMSNASLTLMPPYGAAVLNVSCDDPTVLSVTSVAVVPGSGAAYNITTVALQGLSRGWARLIIYYTDGSWQSVNYYVLPPFRQHISTYGQHASTVAWLPRDYQDPFGRSASVMPWDREDNEWRLQDARPFAVGLSDDAGAAANLGLSARAALAPTVLQASRLDDFVYWTLMGTKNDTATPPLFSLQDPSNNRILMTLFYFDNPSLNTTNYYQEDDKCNLYPSWCTFNSPYPGYNPKGWIAEYRQYNFPHATAVYYALYKIARDWDGVATAAGLRQSWGWYLYRAALTTITVGCPDENSGRLTCIPTVGLMDGTVFRSVLDAVTAEASAGSPSAGPIGWASWQSNITSMMETRVYGPGGPSGDGAAGWVSADFPYGSEFNWDTTGQEEVSVWGAYYNATSPDPAFGELADRAVDGILAFMPSQPNWAMHGAAYGMGDVSNNGKWMVMGGWERESGHYRSGLNSIPVIERFRSHPDDVYLLHIGTAGIANVLPNVDATGAPSMTFHTYPFVQDHDPASGDWGLAFFGHTIGTGAYLLNHTQLGWACYFCDVQSAGSAVTIMPRDTFHTRVYVEPLGLHLNADTGAILNVTVDWTARTVTVVLEAPGSPSVLADWRHELELADPSPAEGVLARPLSMGAAPFSNHRLVVEAAAPTARPYTFTWQSPAGAQQVRGAWTWPVTDPTVTATAVITW